MIEGDLVVVLGKLDTRIKHIEQKELIIGTFIGYIVDKQVQVLLPDGTIYIGKAYEIAPYLPEEKELL